MAEPRVARTQPRATGRNRVLWVATVVTQQGSHRVRVRNLSNTGAQVLCDSALPAGGDAIFKHGDAFVAAKIAWSNEGEAGIQFYRDLEVGGKTAGPVSARS